MSFSIFSPLQNLQQEVQQLIKPVTSIEGKIVNNELHIKPEPGKTIVYLANPIDNLNAPQQFTVIVDKSQSRLGDRLIFFFRMAAPFANPVNISFPPSIFYMTACGGPTTVRGVGHNERVGIYFDFDGEKFVNTFDGC